jgi:hypothetical protein
MALPVNPPPAPTVASATTGGLSAGAYLWAVTYVGNYGETGLGGAAGFTATAGQGAALTVIPAGPAGTVSRNIYRTKAAGTIFFFVGNLGDNTSTTFTDSVADIGLGGAPSQFFQAQGEIQATFVMFDDQRPIASANYGDLNLGPGPWDGTTSGFFAGSASGTALAIDMQSGFAGNLFDFQVAGVSLLSARSDGVLIPQGGGAAGNRGGVAVLTAGATPTDALWTTAPPVGMVVVDTVGAKLWVRTASATWKGVVIA